MPSPRSSPDERYLDDSAHIDKAVNEAQKRTGAGDTRP
jgi:hypothetical protein